MRATPMRILAEAVRRRVGGQPFVLLGHSSGGWMVNAVTALLEKEGSGPAAVVLLDTCTATTSFEERLEAAPFPHEGADVPGSHFTIMEGPLGVDGARCASLAGRRPGRQLPLDNSL
ncbi:thioesterase domain-containing protein [Streptomyces lasiicapitis]|uniref:thioesterase domain-containing protein n=1 Tax=Streptomyces lasiicapitis TaxID=1923961 RepID=UPI00365B4E95